MRVNLLHRHPAPSLADQIDQQRGGVVDEEDEAVLGHQRVDGVDAVDEVEIDHDLGFLARLVDDLVLVLGLVGLVAGVAVPTAHDFFLCGLRDGPEDFPEG